MKKTIVIENWYNDNNYNKRPEQIESQRKALKIKDDKLINLTANSCKIRGSKGRLYDVTLESCTCPNFNHNHNHVCKHMYKLAYMLKLMQPITKNKNLDVQKWDEDYTKVIESKTIKAILFKISADDNSISKNLSIEELTKQLLIAGYKSLSNSSNKILSDELEAFL